MGICLFCLQMALRSISIESLFSKSLNVLQLLVYDGSFHTNGGSMVVLSLSGLLHIDLFSEANLGFNTS